MDAFNYEISQNGKRLTVFKVHDAFIMMATVNFVSKREIFEKLEVIVHNPYGEVGEYHVVIQLKEGQAVDVLPLFLLAW